MTRLEAVFAADEAPGAPLIDGACLELRRGAMAAISGASGAGKTALLSVIAGRLAPAGGEVRFDADGGGEASPRIAFLPQVPALLEGTALDNMTRFRPDLHLEEAMTLAAALGIDGFFARHPQGLSLPSRRGVDPGMPAAVAQGVGLIGGLVGDPDVHRGALRARPHGRCRDDPAPARTERRRLGCFPGVDRSSGASERSEHHSRSAMARSRWPGAGVRTPTVLVRCLVMDGIASA